MSSENTAKLPEWDLADLYDGPEAPGLEFDLNAAEKAAGVLKDTYQGKLASLDGAGLGVAIAAYEAMSEIVQRVMSYGQLLHTINTTDTEIGRFFQTLQERVNAITTDVLFFTLELNDLDEATLTAQMADPAAARYAPWINDTRAFKPHQLDENLEKLLHEKEVAGRGAWVRLFDETLAHLRFDIDGTETTLTDTLNQLTDSDGAKRRVAGKALANGLKDTQRLFTTITNTLAKDKEIEDRWRQFETPAQSRHMANKVETEVVDALAGAVSDSYADLAHRYYGLKAKWMGVKKMDWWDRNAPLPDDAERRFSWDEARETVLGAYRNFDPSMAGTAEDFFTKPWIDAPAREGKASGAFAHPTVPSAHPYILLNFHGKSRDVMTLAHELGHGVHQVLAGPQGLLLGNTPLTLAETASVFGEMLTFRAMLDAEDDPARKRVLLAGKVEDMLNTVVRQIAFHEFETVVHAERQNGELSAERIGDIWMETQTRSLGPVFNFDDDYRMLWAYVPHFIHVPFYVYAYAFGDCLVNALYAVFQDGHPGFQAKYLDMLSQGGAMHHKELLAPFGLDASDPGFWKKGLGVVSGFIDELEEAL
ncbi:MAG: M3 family oligoendopeptidase [Rhodospirillaceae bacterium]|nr:M3 family oligoendopeptidase [Rhodospirillaceae bacterium]